MTRRIVLALGATMVVTLLVAGAVTVGLAHWQARASTEDRLREQAESVASTAVVADDGGDPPAGRRPAGAAPAAPGACASTASSSCSSDLAVGCRASCPRASPRPTSTSPPCRPGRRRAAPTATSSGPPRRRRWPTRRPSPSSRPRPAPTSRRPRRGSSSPPRSPSWSGRRSPWRWAADSPARSVEASAAAHRIADGDLATRLPATGRRHRRRAGRAVPLGQRDGRQPGAGAPARPAVPAVDQPRPAHPADVDPRVRRGDRRRRGARSGRPPPPSSRPRPSGSTASSPTS